MASRKSEEMKQRLLEERDRLLRQKEALENQIAGIERAIALVGGGDDGPQASQARRRSSTKSIVLDLLDDVGTMGLNAATAVEIADRQGTTLDRASVSSLLSRLKRDGVVAYDGDRYRLKKFVPAEKGAAEKGAEAERRSFAVVGSEHPKAAV
jgi:DNA-binding transcriptional regulator LsrR (DeoR family)